MRIVFVVLMTTLLVCFGFSQLRAGAETEKAAVSAAENWLSIMDAGDYSGSWNEASAYFRGAITEQNWSASLEGVRKPLGKLISRKIVKAQASNALPGAPDGKYVVMSFKTAFAQKKSAVETVTFMFDTDGKWRAAGYFIK
jgi:hypothetical protein